jgi:hypothetical protein
MIKEQLVADMLKKAKLDAENTSGNKDGKHSIKFQLPDFVAQTEEPFINNNTLAAPIYQAYTAPVCSVIKEVNTPPPNTIYIFKN